MNIRIMSHGMVKRMNEIKEKYKYYMIAFGIIFISELLEGLKGKMPSPSP